MTMTGVTVLVGRYPECSKHPPTVLTVLSDVDGDDDDDDDDGGDSVSWTLS